MYKKGSESELRHCTDGSSLRIFKAVQSNRRVVTLLQLSQQLRKASWAKCHHIELVLAQKLGFSPVLLFTPFVSLFHGSAFALRAQSPPC